MEKHPAIGYRLNICVWEITRACNFSCAHCGSSAGRTRPDELSTTEALEVADQLIDLQCRRVVLIGGEVFMRRDWDVIAQRLVNGGLNVSVITNGSRFSAETWHRLSAAGVSYVAVSIDGNRAHHDALRAPGSYQAGMDALEEANRRGLTTAAITVLNVANVRDLPEVYEELAARRVDAWQIQLCSPFGNARHDSGLVPSLEQIRQAADFIATQNRALFSRGKDLPFPRIFAADNIGYHTDDEGVIRGYPGACFRECGAGISVVGIDSAGNVRGCESLYDDAFIEGNLRTRTLRDIWESPDAFAYNRKFTREMLTGACAFCIYGEDCAGGCRSLNYFHAGNLYEAPLCIRAGVNPPNQVAGV